MRYISTLVEMDIHVCLFTLLVGPLSLLTQYKLLACLCGSFFSTSYLFVSENFRSSNRVVCLFVLTRKRRKFKLWVCPTGWNE